VILARGSEVGFAISSKDAFLSATAETHALTLVTGNVKDFERIRISMLDPWASRPSG
jgi:predicted nucleic acid-binding protein